MRTFGIVCKSGKEEEDERVKETKNPEISPLAFLQGLEV